MFLGIRRTYWLLLVISIAVIGIVLTVSRSSVFAWRTMTVAGPLVEMNLAAAAETMPDGNNLFGLDRGEMADRLLARPEIEQISLVYDWPSGMRAEVNRFQPVALMCDGEIWGVDRFGRALPYDTAWESIDLPVLTGMRVKGLFNLPSDGRAVDVIHALVYLQDEFPDQHRQLAEIDFSDRIWLGVHLTTGWETYLAVAPGLEKQLVKMFVFRESTAVKSNGCYDLSYDGIVIGASGKR